MIFYGPMIAFPWVQCTIQCTRLYVYTGYIFLCHKHACVVYVGKLPHSEVLSQLMSVVHNICRTCTELSPSLL